MNDRVRGRMGVEGVRLSVRDIGNYPFLRRAAEISADWPFEMGLMQVRYLLLLWNAVTALSFKLLYFCFCCPVLIWCCQVYMLKVSSIQIFVRLSWRDLIVFNPDYIFLNVILSFTLTLRIWSVTLLRWNRMLPSKTFSFGFYFLFLFGLWYIPFILGICRKSNTQYDRIFFDLNPF